MSTASVSYKTDGITRGMIATITATGAALAIPLGFQPRRIRLYDPASVIVWEWVQGMPATDSFKFATGALTLDTGSAIVVQSKDSETITDQEGNVYDPGVTFSAAAMVAGHTLLAHFE
jgi:hypothetical protein